jgi:hypothetical protein
VWRFPLVAIDVAGSYSGSRSANKAPR